MPPPLRTLEAVSSVVRGGASGTVFSNVRCVCPWAAAISARLGDAAAYAEVKLRRRSPPTGTRRATALPARLLLSSTVSGSWRATMAELTYVTAACATSLALEALAASRPCPSWPLPLAAPFAHLPFGFSEMAADRPKTGAEFILYVIPARPNAVQGGAVPVSRVLLRRARCRRVSGLHPAPRPEFHPPAPPSPTRSPCTSPSWTSSSCCATSEASAVAVLLMPWRTKTAASRPGHVTALTAGAPLAVLGRASGEGTMAAKRGGSQPRVPFATAKLPTQGQLAATRQARARRCGRPTAVPGTGSLIVLDSITR